MRDHEKTFRDLTDHQSTPSGSVDVRFTPTAPCGPTLRAVDTTVSDTLTLLTS